MSLNILNSNKKSSRKAKILPQFSISSENKPLLDLLEIQRKSFFDFLQDGIPHELAKIAVFRETAKNSTCKQELELKFNPETYKFISPNFTPKEAILNGKTYACKVYVQATLMIRSPNDIQKTNLFSVVTSPHISLPDQSSYKSTSLNPKGVSCATCTEPGLASHEGLRKEKVKQRRGFYSLPLASNSFALQALQGTRVKAGTSQLLQIFEPIRTPSGYSYSKNKAWASSAVTKENLSAIARVNPRYPYTNGNGALDLRFVRSDANIPLWGNFNAELVPEGVKLQQSKSITVQLYKPKRKVWGISSWGVTSPYPVGVSEANISLPDQSSYKSTSLNPKGVNCATCTEPAPKGLRSSSVRSWGFGELHIRFAKAHLRQCWLPLSKTLLSKKLHIGLFANSLTPSSTNPAQLRKPMLRKGVIELLAVPQRGMREKGMYASELLKNKESNILEKQLIALHETAKLKSLYITKQKQLQLLFDAPLPFVNSSQRILTLPQKGMRWSPASAVRFNMRLLRTGDTATVSLIPSLHTPWGYSTTRPTLELLAQLRKPQRGLRERGIYASQLRKKKDYSSTPTGLEATQNIQIFRPWIFLGELPLMTKRGHFILNGSPRVIVNQIARCPGIYFQEKRRGVGIEQEIRVSADLIPQRGPWLRIQSDWEGRFWARLKQEGRVKYATLYEAFQEFEKEYNPPLICLLSNSYFTNTTSSLFSKSENITFQERKIKEDRQKKALIRLFKNSSRYSLGKLGRSRVNERIHSSFTRPSHSTTQAQGGLRNWQGKKDIAQLKGLLQLSYGAYPFRGVQSPEGVSSVNTTTICNSWQSKPNNEIRVASGIHSCNSTRNDEKQRNSEGTPKELQRSCVNELCKRIVLTNCVNEVRHSPNNGINGLITSNYANSINYINNFLTDRKNILQILGSETDSGAQLRKPFNAALIKAYTDTYPERACEAELPLNSADKELRYFFNEGYSLQNYDLLLQQHKVSLEKELANPFAKHGSMGQSNRVKEPISSSRRYLLKEEQLLQQHEDSFEEELAQRQRNSKKIVLTNCVNELMAKDLDAIHTCLERLLEGQGFTDDIDNLKNRFIRTSGKLLQQQFELGLFRLNEVIMPLLGNLLPDYPRLTKSKYSTNKNIKENNSSLPDTNLGDKLKPAYGVRSTRVLSTSNNYNKDNILSGYIIDSPREWNPLRVTPRAVARVTPPAIARVNPFTFTLVSPLFNHASPVCSQLCKTNPSYYKSSSRRVPVQRIPHTSSEPVRSKHFVSTTTSLFIPLGVKARRFVRRFSIRVGGIASTQGVWGTATVCNSWQNKKGLLPQQYVQSKEKLVPLLRCTNQQLKGQKLFTSSLLPVLTERQRGKHENFIYLREAEMKKPVADGYSKEVSLIKNAPFRWLRTSKPINSAFREFFGSNPLSQYMDQTNPLAEITHKRRLSSMGPGGIKRETAGMEVRGIHPTHYGRVCPIETPEGKNAGLVNSPTVYGRVGNYGFLETPLYQVIENQVQTKRWTFFSAQYEERQNSSLATCDTGLLQFNFLPHVPIPVQTANNPLTHFQQVERHRVGYRALSPIQTISIATALIPFLEHDDANRALMGSNMQRQAIPLLSPERPIVGTGFEPLVVMESGQALQATKLGCVSQADANSIIIHTRYSIEKPLSQNILQNFDLPWSRALVHRFGIRLPHTNLRFSMRLLRLPHTNRRFVRGMGGTAKNGVVNLHSHKWQFSYCAHLFRGMQSPLQVASPYPVGVSKANISFPNQSSYKSTSLNPKGVSCATCTEHALGGLKLEDLSENEMFASHGLAESFINKKHISYLHNTFLLRPLKQDLQFYERSNQETCLNQRPLVQEGDWIQKGDFLADSSASRSGDLALGKNVTVAYMPWEGYNFEDAIVISDRLVSDDIYTSLHIERYEIKVSKNSQGKERITNRIPGSSHSLKHLDNFGIARVSSWVQPGDILVGKVVELKRPLSPYERLAWELASRLSPKSPEREKWLNKVWLEDISLRLPPGVCGRVINSQIISTEYASMSDPSLLGIPQGSKYKEQTIYPQEVHVYLAVKRKIQIGDKLAGRHGNKGIVSAILPQEDMPYLGNGSCIDMVLNPLGVPSRMNLGQIFECLLGLAGSQLGCNFRITPFDEIAGGEASRSLVFLKLYQCRLMYKQQWLFTPTFPGKSKLFDGRTGEPFENWVTVGQAYMLKLIHMVDHKIHARSTGPYSLFTRQPVRGRSRRGGQRLGEMEVWAVEGFGAAYTLQEFLTIKSDDLKARTALQKGFYKQNDVTFGKIHIAPGNPEAFKVLVSELQALCLHIQM